MTNPAAPRPIHAIVPALPESDRRPTLVRPNSGNSIFSGWGPKL